MSKKLPSHVQISAFNYTISVDQDYLDKEGAERGKTLVGLSELNDQKITISEAADDYMADTLLHEILHQCIMVTGIEIRNLKLEEQLITTITPMLLDTLRRNPEVVEYLLGM